MYVFASLIKNTTNQYRLKKCLRNILIQLLSKNYFCHGWIDKSSASLASPRGRPELLHLQLRRPLLLQLLLLNPVRVRGTTAAAATTARLATAETGQPTSLFANCGKQSTGAKNFLRWSAGNDSSELFPPCKCSLKYVKMIIYFDEMLRLEIAAFISWINFIELCPGNGRAVNQHEPKCFHGPKDLGQIRWRF